MNVTPGNPSNDEMFCSAEGGVFRNFYQSAIGTLMTFTKDEVFYRVRLVPVEEDEVDYTDRPGRKICWHDFKSDRFCFVFDSLNALRCCFAYGIDSAEERGNGVRCRVRVEALEKYTREQMWALNKEPREESK